MTIVGDTSKARLIAAAIDHIIALGLMFFLVAQVPEELPWLKATLFFGVYLLYYFVLEALWSRTVGKFFQGLMVRKLDGTRCDWKAALIRTAARVIEVNPLLLGGLPAGIAIMASHHKQRIGDILARTVVVSTKLHWTPELLALGDADAPPPPPAFER
jgi:uncharacterized RDD family membrane protein YckC